MQWWCAEHTIQKELLSLVGECARSLHLPISKTTYIVMLAEILITVGVLLLYCSIAMGIHHWCDREDAACPSNNIAYADTYGHEYSLIE